MLIEFGFYLIEFLSFFLHQKNTLPILNNFLLFKFEINKLLKKYEIY